MTEYADIVSQFHKVAIASDGLGIVSYYCYKNDIEYYSWEPNKVGNRARNIGLITSTVPIIDDSYVYLYFYCHSYYSLPAFPGQRYVVVDLPENLPKYPLPRYPGVCSTEKIRLKHVKLKTPAFVCSKYYALDELSREIMDKVGARESNDILDTQFIVFSKISSIQTAMKRTIYTIPYLTSYIKAKKLQYTPPHLLEKIKNKTVYLPRKNFPFKERVKIGDMTITDGFVYWHYGVGDYIFHNGLIRGTNEIGNASIVSDYAYLNGFVVIRHSRPEIVKSIKLKPEHRAMSDTVIVPVLLINIREVDRVRYGHYILSSLANYDIPSVELLV
jgi:hypothetical protein